MIGRWAMLVLTLALLATSAALSACQNMGGADPAGGSQFGTPYDGTWFKGRPD